MHSAVEVMLEKYRCSSAEEYKNALKEIIQEIALLGLFRANFFDIAAFYGGTALRIFYSLPRFSEDLDFSLLKKTDHFNLMPYCEYIRKELQSFGFEMEVITRYKLSETAIESAFIKGNTLIHLLKIGVVHPPVSGVHSDDMLKIKLEIDTDPPAGASCDIKYLLTPIPFHVRLYSPGSLFAGKLHAVLCRNWNKGRVKGRDLYDYVWYLSRKVSLSVNHLVQRMVQSGHLSNGINLDRDAIVKLLDDKFQTIDFKQAKADMLPFVKDAEELRIWSAEFFSAITHDSLIIESN
jgi:predicted nucleotidyltransferase component of viral defense system